MAWRLLTLILAWRGFAFLEENCGESSLNLLQRRAVSIVDGAKGKKRLFGEERAAVLEGRSCYFVVIDRFARTDGNVTACNDDKRWCGGTLKGITSKLDYIAGMGFDCLWITPVVKQYEGETQDGTGFMGYWAKNHYEIDPHFGSAQDLKDLVTALHAMGMVIMLDIVANHVGPIHSSSDVHGLYPFNDTSYYHTLEKGTLSFDEYVAPGHRKESFAHPIQAMWSNSGAQCPVGESCNCFTCVPTPMMVLNDYQLLRAVDQCPFGQMIWNYSSPCDWASLSAFCMPGDYKCKGYNETITLDGWFYDLGDLNQSHPEVRDGLKRWARWLATEFDIDIFRLDTAAFMPQDFLHELQEAAGIPIIGEVTATNLSYHASFQNAQGMPLLDGVLNFPLYYTAVAGFCHTWFPYATGNLSYLGQRMSEQFKEAPYKNVKLLGNFIDNHDVKRLGSECAQDKSRMANAIAFIMLMPGVPIVYYGTELRFSEQRKAMWSRDELGQFWPKYPVYYLFSMMNRFRKELHLTTDTIVEEHETVRYSRSGHQNDPTTMVFSRGSKRDVWVFLNNVHTSDVVYRYCILETFPKPEEGKQWMNFVDGQPPVWGDDNCLYAPTNLPLIFAQYEIEKPPMMDEIAKFNNEVQHAMKNKSNPYPDIYFGHKKR